MNICLICLRTDRLLKIASDVLEEFHDELVNFSTVNMAASSYFCSECEYILSKFYKFKQKCLEALRIYMQWKSTKKKLSINRLFTLLPPSTLGTWKPNPKKIGNYIMQGTDSQSNMCEEHVLLTDTCPKKDKLEIGQPYTQDNNTIADLKIELKIENISENVPKLGIIDEIQNDGQTEVSLFDNLDELLEDTEECTNLKIIKQDPEDSDKETKISISKKLSIKKNTAKNEKLVESVLKSIKRHSNKVTARMKRLHARVIQKDQKYKSVFDIEYLWTPQMKVEEFQRRKTYESYVKAEYKCEICYLVVKNAKFLEYHTKNWHNETEGKVCCPICKLWTRKGRSHSLSHTVVFKCKLCPLVTHQRTSMRNHFDSHKGKQYNCEQCKATYKSKSSYLTHLGKAHRQGRNVCESCGRGFYSPLGLTMHKTNSIRCTVAKETSSEQKETTEGVRCDECDVTLPSLEVYSTHMSDVHYADVRKGPRVVTDGVTAAGLPGYRKHVMALNSRKVKCDRRFPKITCRVCNKVGISFGWLKLHFKREHPNEDMNILYADMKKHLCDVCGAGFSSLYALRDHTTKHTGAVPYACDMCPRRFRCAYLLRDHRLRHFPSTIPCNHCGKLFTTKANLYSHMRTHTNEKDFKCHLCGKGFLHGSSLKEHIQGVHYNIRRVKKRREGETPDTGPRKRPKRGKRKNEEETDTDSSSDSE